MVATEYARVVAVITLVMGGSSIDDNMSANAVNTDPDKNQSKNGDNSHTVVVCTSTTKDSTKP